jgi:hypothetical protein
VVVEGVGVGSGEQELHWKSDVGGEDGEGGDARRFPFALTARRVLWDSQIHFRPLPLSTLPPPTRQTTILEL